MKGCDGEAARDLFIPIQTDGALMIIHLPFLPQEAKQPQGGVMATAPRGGPCLLAKGLPGHFQDVSTYEMIPHGG